MSKGFKLKIDSSIFRNLMFLYGNVATSRIAVEVPLKSAIAFKNRVLRKDL